MSQPLTPPPVAAEAPHRAARALTANGIGLWEYGVADGRLWLDAAARRLLGLAGAGEPLAWSELLLRAHPDDGEQLFAAIDEAMAGGSPVARVRLDCGEPEPRWCDIAAERSRSDRSGSDSVGGWIRDAHEDQEIQIRARVVDEQLARQHRLAAIDQCAGGVAHEFKNVLQIIRGYTAFARKSVTDEATAADLDQAILATDRANAVAQQLLHCSRTEDDELQHSDVNELLTELAHLLRPLIGNETELSIGVGATPLMIRGRDGSLRQILINLCLNARDAMPRGGRLLVRAEAFRAAADRPEIGAGLAAGDYARLFVTDTGTGIADDALPQLFEPFYSTKDAAEGVGLGLTVVRKMATDAGGTVAVASREGVGTTVSVYLPIDPVDSSTSLAPARGRLLLWGPRAEAASDALRDAGWRVASADAAAPFDAPGFAAVLADADRLAADGDRIRAIAGDAAVVALTELDPEAGLARIDPDAVDAAVFADVEATLLGGLLASPTRRLAEAAE